MENDRKNATHWKNIRWANVTKGQEVFLKGTNGDGNFMAYGPHTVVNRRHYKLKSGTPDVKGKVFKHVPEELLVPVMA